MAHEIRLPQWGMEMQDGTIVKWLKNEGDPIQEGEALVAIETAKIETELESNASGVVAHILVGEGETVPIRTVLAVVAAAGEDVPRPARAVSSASAPAAAPAAGARAAAPAGSAGRAQAAQVVPAARRLAQQTGIDLKQVHGTGPRGRILIEDVQRAIQARQETGP